VAVGGLGVDGHLLAGPRARHLLHVERPEHRGPRDEELDVHDVRAQALAAAPAEAVRAELAVAEVGVLCQGLLVRWERWVEPPVGSVGLWVWVFLGDAVDGPVGGFMCELVALRHMNHGVEQLTIHMRA